MVAGSKNAPLEDIMAAMDVVDTLRHDKNIAQRELDGEGRRGRLLARLRTLYAAQGIDVADSVLEQGIEALEKERFKYQAVAPSWRTKLAYIWVSRVRWGKPIGFLAVVGVIFYSYYFFSDVLPERAMRANLPNQVNNVFSSIVAIAKNPEVIDQAKISSSGAYRAIDEQDFELAQEIVSNMQHVKAQLSLEYSIRVISKPKQNSGIWRNPPNNPNGKNYYLIVEAVDDANRVVELSILNQEDNEKSRRKTWGLRVSEDTFYKVAADKSDDGIIQNNNVGTKTAGYLEPVFNIPTTGATITEW